MSEMSQQRPDADDVGAFIDQARWLLEWHNQRAESLMTRAMTVAGFDGVVLAVILQGASIDGVRANWLTWVLLVGLVILLLSSAGFAFGVVMTRPVAIGRVGQLRGQWAAYRRTQTPGKPSFDVAESLLNSSQLTGPSPVSDAANAADQRVRWFKWSIICTLLAMVLLGALVLDVLILVWRS